MSLEVSKTIPFPTPFINSHVSKSWKNLVLRQFLAHHFAFRIDQIDQMENPEDVFFKNWTLRNHLRNNQAQVKIVNMDSRILAIASNYLLSFPLTSEGNISIYNYQDETVKQLYSLHTRVGYSRYLKHDVFITGIMPLEIRHLKKEEKFSYQQGILRPLNDDFAIIIQQSTFHLFDVKNFKLLPFNFKKNEDDVFFKLQGNNLIINCYRSNLIQCIDFTTQKFKWDIRLPQVYKIKYLGDKYMLIIDKKEGCPAALVIDVNTGMILRDFTGEKKNVKYKSDCDYLIPFRVRNSLELFDVTKNKIISNIEIFNNLPHAEWRIYIHRNRLVVCIDSQKQTLFLFNLSNLKLIKELRLNDAEVMNVDNGYVTIKNGGNAFSLIDVSTGDIIKEGNGLKAFQEGILFTGNENTLTLKNFN